VTDPEIDRHFLGKPWSAPNAKPKFKPTDKPTHWKCLCGRRYRGDATLQLHHARARHGFAYSLHP
jgi:hypothetical protein